MQPEQQNANQNQTPTPPPMPQQPQFGVPPVPPQPTVMYQQPVAKKSNTGLIVGIIVGAVVIFGAAITGFVVFGLIPWLSENQKVVEQRIDVPDSQDKTTNETIAKSGDKCFYADDYSHALGWRNDITFTKNSPFTGNVHFQPDSLEYAQPVYDQGVRTIAQLVQDNPDKKYHITVRGSVATANESDKDFALRRANKVKDQLVSLGVSADSIQVAEPDNITAMGGTGSDNEVLMRTARSVVMEFYPDCSI